MNERTNEIKWNFRQFAIDSMSMLWYVWRQQCIVQLRRNSIKEFIKQPFSLTVLGHSNNFICHMDWAVFDFPAFRLFEIMFVSKAFIRIESLLFCQLLWRVREHYSWQLHNDTILFVEFHLRNLCTIVHHHDGQMVAVYHQWTVE